jgi:fluoride ion exporter CrcB/FEX
MNAVLWKVVTAIVLGSAAGALLRETTIILAHRTAGSSSGLTLAVSGIGGAVVGIAMGWVATATTTEAVQRQLAMIGLVAVLGTFAAAAVLNSSPSSPEAAAQMLYTAALNIGAAILTAAISLGIVRSLRSR